MRNAVRAGKAARGRLAGAAGVVVRGGMLLLVACVDPTDTATPTDTTATTPEPSFAEPFDTVDDTRWTAADWMLGATQLDGRYATVVDGVLELAHVADDAEGWRGAELYTTETFAGGTWEVQMARPTSGGTVCAAFFYGSDADGFVNEIDIELLPDAAWFSVYRNWTEADGYEISATHDTMMWAWTEAVPADAQHTYRLSWGADTLRFAIDGAEVGTLGLVPAVPIALHVNHWTSTTWSDVGYPPPATSTCRIADVTGWAG